jgi:hypothetical protein
MQEAIAAMQAIVIDKLRSFESSHKGDRISLA